MKCEFLPKKFSVGISYSLMNTDQIISILDKYNKFIYEIYFSPVEKLKYQTRKYIYDFDRTSKEERLKGLSKVLEYSKKNDIKLNLTLNAHNNVEEQLELFFYYNSLFNINYVTTFSSVAHSIKNKFDFNNIICTYNEGIDGILKLQKIIASQLFSKIVIGGSLIRNFNAFHLLNKSNIKVKLLLNNGCMFNCNNFCRNKILCKQDFYNQLRIDGINKMYAQQSILPEELHNFYISSNLIDTYKLSTRPISLQELDLLLESYIEGDSKKYITSNIDNYHLYARLNHFCRFYQQIDYDDIICKKEKIWKDAMVAI